MGSIAQDRLRPHIASRVCFPQPAKGHRYDQQIPTMAVGLTAHIGTWGDSLVI